MPETRAGAPIASLDRNMVGRLASDEEVLIATIWLGSTARAKPPNPARAPIAASG